MNLRPFLLPMLAGLVLLAACMRNDAAPIPMPTQALPGRLADGHGAGQSLARARLAPYLVAHEEARALLRVRL